MWRVAGRLVAVTNALEGMRPTRFPGWNWNVDQLIFVLPEHHKLSCAMSIIWTIIIGFLAGLIARWIHPGVSNEPSGFVLTTLLGIAGAFVATFVGQAIGWYHAGEGAGLIGAVVGAVIMLLIWGMFAGRTARV